MNLEIFSRLYMITVNKDLIMPIRLPCSDRHGPATPVRRTTAHRSRERAR